MIQFVGGVWSGDVTFFAASATMAFSCVDFVAPPNIGSSEPFVVLPGAFAGLQVLLPGQRPVGGRDPGFTGEPAPQTAGVPFTAVVQAVDAWWNPVSGVAAGVDPRRSPIPSRSRPKLRLWTTGGSRWRSPSCGPASTP